MKKDNKKPVKKNTTKKVVKKKVPEVKEIKIESSLTVLPENVKLNIVEERFVDEYMIDLNATQSYMRARGYTEYKESYRVTASRWLSKANVKKAIEERKKLLRSDAIADANEVLEFFSQVMRGEVKDQLGFETSVRDRLKAGEKLAQRYKVFEEKQEGNKKQAPKINILVTDNSHLEAEMYKNEK